MEVAHDLVVVLVMVQEAEQVGEREKVAVPDLVGGLVLVVEPRRVGEPETAEEPEPVGGLDPVVEVATVPAAAVEEQFYASAVLSWPRWQDRLK
jgi:hypothetical protein